LLIHLPSLEIEKLVQPEVSSRLDEQGIISHATAYHGSEKGYYKV
jgi:hypothetical protein